MFFHYILLLHKILENADLNFQKLYLISEGRYCFYEVKENFLHAIEKVRQKVLLIQNGGFHLIIFFFLLYMIEILI